MEADFRYRRSAGMKLVGLTAYGIEIRDEENNSLELHDICERSLLDYMLRIKQWRVFLLTMLWIFKRLEMMQVKKNTRSCI